MPSALLADFVDNLVFACDQQPTCQLTLVASDDPSFSPLFLRLFSTPLLVSATDSSGVMQAPREAISVLVEQQAEDQTTTLAVPRLVLQKGMEHLEMNAALLTTDGLSFLYL